MRRFLLFTLLTVSLVFNAGFVVGYVYVRNLVAALRTPEGRIDLVGRRIGVDERTRALCVGIERDRLAERRRILASERAGLDAFYAETVRDDPDMERLRAMVDAGMDLHRRLLRNDLEHFMRIAAHLTPEQRRIMARIVRDEDLFAE